MLELVENRNPMISLPLQSYLDNIVNDICENHQLQIEESQDSKEEKSLVSKFLMDIIFIADQQRPSWYPPTTPVYRLQGMRWVNKVLVAFGVTIFDSQDMISILKFNLTPSIKRILQQYQPPISSEMFVEVFKCLVNLINGSPREFGDIIEVFKKYIEHSDHSYSKTLSIESIIYLAQNGYFLSLLLGNETERATFISILVAFQVLSKQLNTTNCIFPLKIPRSQHIEGRKEDLAVSDPAIVIGMIAEFHIVLSLSFVNYYMNSLKDKLIKEDYRNFIKQVECVWRYSLSTLKAILDRKTCESIEQACLEACGYYIQVLGEVYNRQGQQEFIDLLCTHSLTYLGAQTSLVKTLLRNGSLIDAIGWVKMLKALFSCEQQNEKLHAKQRSSYEDIQKTQTMSQLSIELSEIFKLSASYTDPQIVTILDALNQVTMKEEFGQFCYFLRVSVEVNIYRIDIFWELITAHYLAFANSKFQNQRIEGVTTMSEIIIKSFSYFAKYYKLKPHHENEWKVASEKREKALKEQEEELKKAMDMSKQEEKERKEAFQKLQQRAETPKVNFSKNQENLKKRENDDLNNSVGIIQKEQKENVEIKEDQIIQARRKKPSPEEEKSKPKDLFKSLFETIDFLDLDFDKNIPEDLVNENEKEIENTKNQFENQEIKGQEKQQDSDPEIEIQQQIKLEVPQVIDSETVTQKVEPNTGNIKIQEKVPDQEDMNYKEETKNDIIQISGQTGEIENLEVEEIKQKDDTNQHQITKNDLFQPAFQHKIIEKEKWNETNWQMTLFKPWLEMLTIRYTETKQVIVEYLLKLLQNCGHQIQGEGWCLLLKIISEVSGEQTSVYAKEGLKCIQYLIDLYLGQFDKQSVTLLFDIIQNIRINSKDQSVDLEFCEILWHLGDFVSRGDDSSDQMFRIFRQLKELSVNENREVRHTMLHILTTLLQHNCSKYGHEFWASVLEEIYYPIMHSIISCYYEKLASHDRDSSSWQFTAKTLVRTSNKLFKRFLGFNQKHSSQKLLNYHFKMMATLLNQLQAELHYDVIVCMKDLFILKPVEHQAEQLGFLDALQYIRMVFTLVPDTVIYTKNLVERTLPEAINFISALLQYFTEISEIDSSRYFKDVISLYVRVINFPSLGVMTYNDLSVSPQTINQLVNPVKEMNDLLTKCGDLFLPHYQNFIQSILVIPPTDQYADRLLRVFIFAFSEQPRVHEELLKQIPSFMCHRWKSSYHRWFNSNQSLILTPIWQFGYEQMFELSVKLLTTPPYRFEFVFSELLNNFQACDIALLQSYISGKLLKLLVLMELKTLSFLYKKFANSPFALQQIGEQHLNICEKFTQVLYEMSSPEQLCFDGCPDINLGLESLKLLMEMCHLSEGGKPEWQQHLEERGRISVPFMIHRVSTIFKYISKEQEKENQIPSQHIIQIANMLNYIRIPKQSFPFRGEKGLTKQLNEGLQNTNLSYLNNFHSGHLVYLFPQLTKAMEVLNDLQCRGAIREALDRCFKEIQAKS